MADERGERGAAESGHGGERAGDPPRLRDVDHDAPDGLATNDVFDRGSVETDGSADDAGTEGETHRAPGPRADAGGDAPAEADE